MQSARKELHEIVNDSFVLSIPTQMGGLWYEA